KVEPRVISVAGKVVVEEQSDDNSNDVVVFNQEKVAKSCVKKGEYRVFINNQKLVKIGHILEINNFGNCYQSGFEVEKYESRAVINNQSQKDERIAFKWDLKSARSEKLPESYELLEAAYITLNDSAKVDEKCSLDNNNLQEICNAGMDKGPGQTGLIQLL
ncbi:15966_t:CDS:2, partial [Dentiscutata heterogama]